MVIYINLLLVVSLIFSTACNQDNIDRKGLKKGTFLLLKSDFDNCEFNYLEKQELNLFHADNGEILELEIDYPRYNYDFPSISPSGEMIISKHKTNENLILYNIKEDLLSEIPYHKIRSRNLLRFGPTFEFYDDSTIFIGLKSDLYRYNIKQESFIKLSSFGVKIIDEINISEHFPDRIFLKLQEMGDFGEVSDIQYVLYNFDGSTFNNEKILNIPFIMDISPDGNNILAWKDSLYIYNIETETTEKIVFFESLAVAGKTREVKFLDEVSIVFTDIINDNKECYSKLIIYNFVKNEIEKEFNLGKNYFEIVRVFN